MNKTNLCDFAEDIQCLVSAAEELSNLITDYTIFQDAGTRTLFETLNAARECVFEKLHTSIRQFENSIEDGTEETA